MRRPIFTQSLIVVCKHCRRVLDMDEIRVDLIRHDSIIQPVRLSECKNRDQCETFCKENGL